MANNNIEQYLEAILTAIEGGDASLPVPSWNVEKYLAAIYRAIVENRVPVEELETTFYLIEVRDVVWEDTDFQGYARHDAEAHEAIAAGRPICVRVLDEDEQIAHLFIERSREEGNEEVYCSSGGARSYCIIEYGGANIHVYGSIQS